MEKEGKPISVMVRATPELLAALDKDCGGVGGGGRGNTGGRSGWATILLHRHYGLEAAVMTKRVTLPSLAGIDLNLCRLDKKTLYIARLYQEGASVDEILKTLEEKKIPRSSNIPWNQKTIKGIITRVHKKHVAEAAQEPETWAEDLKKPKMRAVVKKPAPPPPPPRKK